MRPSLRTLSKFIHPTRSLSSQEAVVAEINIPSSISSNFHNRVEEFYGSIDASYQKPKELNDLSIANWTKELNRTIKKEDPNLARTLEDVRNSKDITIVVLNGVSHPEVLSSEVPKSEAEFHDNTSLQKKLKKIEAIFSAYTGNIGITPEQYTADNNYVGYIFSDPQSKHLSRTEGKLRWHTDGWQNPLPPENIVLMGLHSNKTRVHTEITTFDQIVDHFRKNNKDDLLQSLNRYCQVINPMSEIDPHEQVRILNLEKKEIIFSHQGNFYTLSNSKKFGEALLYLEDALEEIKPFFSDEIRSGMIVGLNNLKNVHQKKPKGDMNSEGSEKTETTHLTPGKNVKAEEAKRLLGRMVGNKDNSILK